MTAPYFRYRASGPVADAVLKDPPRRCLPADGSQGAEEGVRDFLGIMGPYGSGKTTVLFLRALRLAQMQRRSQRDGLRHTKVSVVRDTLTQLHKTTLGTYKKVMNPDLGEWVGGRNESVVHSFPVNGPDPDSDLPLERRKLVRVAQITFEFLAIGDAHNAEQVLDGYEPTFWLLNAIDKLPDDTLTFTMGRAGRYPTLDHCEPLWAGVLSDMNAPLIGSAIHEQLFENLPINWELKQQPPAVIRTSGATADWNDWRNYRLHPEAENLKNLPARYYEKMIATGDEAFIRRMVMNQPGFSRAGKAVYGAYNDDLHSQDGLKPIPGIPLQVGLDAGGTPAAVIMQFSPLGQWRAYREVATPPDKVVGPHRFAEQVKAVLDTEFEGFEYGPLCPDPSACYGGDEDDERDAAFALVVSKVLGCSVRRGITNVPALRRDAMRRALETMIDGRFPGLVLDRRGCPILRTGLSGGFVIRPIQDKIDERYQDNPVKNRYSHVVEAAEYPIVSQASAEELVGIAGLAGNVGRGDAAPVQGVRFYGSSR